MKKLALTLALLLTLTLVPAHAEIDLSGMTLAELMELSQQVTMAMWETEEWEEVEVPIGVYEIGVDIPAKHWNIAAANGSFPEITYASKLDASGRSAEWEDIIHDEHLLGSGYKYYDNYAGEYPASIDLDLSNGGYLIVEDGAVVFTPYTGKANLGFK